MELMSEDQELILRQNSALQSMDPNGCIDFIPVIKLFTPDANATWLLTELDPYDEFFGLCDLGQGCPELGYVSLDELKKLKGKLNLPVERDLHFAADKPLSAYVATAMEKGKIIT